MISLYTIFESNLQYFFIGTLFLMYFVILYHISFFSRFGDVVEKICTNVIIITVKPKEALFLSLLQVGCVIFCITNIYHTRLNKLDFLKRLWVLLFLFCPLAFFYVNPIGNLIILCYCIGILSNGFSIKPLICIALSACACGLFYDEFIRTEGREKMIAFIGGNNSLPLFNSKAAYYALRIIEKKCKKKKGS